MTSPTLPPASSCVILVPVGGYVEPGCEEGLRELERRGYPVWRVRGYSAVDAARNQMATDTLAQGFEELLWIDSDGVFDPNDVERVPPTTSPSSVESLQKRDRDSSPASSCPVQRQSSSDHRADSWNCVTAGLDSLTPADRCSRPSRKSCSCPHVTGGSAHLLYPTSPPCSSRNPRGLGRSRRTMPSARGLDNVGSGSWLTPGFVCGISDRIAMDGRMSRLPRSDTSVTHFAFNKIHRLESQDHLPRLLFRLRQKVNRGLTSSAEGLLGQE
jgi:hypothetical protein